MRVADAGVGDEPGAQLVPIASQLFSARCATRLALHRRIAAAGSCSGGARRPALRRLVAAVVVGGGARRALHARAQRQPLLCALLRARIEELAIGCPATRRHRRATATPCRRCRPRPVSVLRRRRHHRQLQVKPAAAAPASPDARPRACGGRPMRVVHESRGQRRKVAPAEQHYAHIQYVPQNEQQALQRVDCAVHGGDEKDDKAAQIARHVAHERRGRHGDAPAALRHEDGHAEAEARDVHACTYALTQCQGQVHGLAVRDGRHLREEIRRAVAKGEQCRARHVIGHAQPGGEVSDRGREELVRRQRERRKDKHLDRPCEASAHDVQGESGTPRAIHRNSARMASGSERCLATTSQ